MGFYSHVIVPRLCDLVLNQSRLARYRRELLRAAHGKVVEIGFGTGLNLAHYPQGVDRISAVDPNPGMHRLARKRIRQSAIPVDPQVLRGETLPFADNRFDCAVSTFTLCSIEDGARAVREVYRVLKPGGKFLFLEHGLCPDRSVQKWQRRLNGLQMRLADGCHLDRNMRELVTAPPFAAVAIEEFRMERIPRTHGYLYRGTAVK